MNKDTFNLVVKILGLTILLSLGLIGALALRKVEIPGVLENIAVAALAGMTGLLARSPGNEEPVPTTIVNTPAQPVPVVDH